MALSSDLISQFVKVTSDKSKEKKEAIMYGTVSIDDKGDFYVKLDGSNILTPISTTAGVASGERVIVMIKNHSAVIIGNLSSPSVRTEYVRVIDQTVDEVKQQVNEFGLLIAGKVSTEEFYAEVARIDTLQTNYTNVQGKLTAHDADINTLEANEVVIKERLEVVEAEISELKATTAMFDYATIGELDSAEAKIDILISEQAAFETATATRFASVEGRIDILEADKLTVAQLSAQFANIDFSNIGEAAIEHFYSTSGLIENVVVGDGTITGKLVGVTISGDLIEGNTVKAEKLVIKGEDGLYYKLNTDGITTAAEQTEYNSINGQVIMAKSITATQISVNDLVAFDATIGGFTITEDSIYSDVKDSDGNTTRGIYMDTDGQINFGDANNFIKYYKDTDGTYKLTISASSILYALDEKQYSIADLGRIGDYVHIGTYEGEPCIELGENDSDFKLVITNTRIMFMEGSDLPAYINNQSLNIKKAVIEEELQEGGFVWKIRSNGNLALIWKGDDE